MPVPKSWADEMMQKPKFKSFFFTCFFISALATPHLDRYHFKSLLEFLTRPWLLSGIQGNFSFHGHFQAWERSKWLR